LDVDNLLVMLAMSEALISNEDSTSGRHDFLTPYSSLHPIEVHQRQATANRLHTRQVLNAHIQYQSPGLMQMKLLANSQKKQNNAYSARLSN
jgi:hypothetical protein